MKLGKDLRTVAQEIERRANAKRDFVVPDAKLSMSTGTNFASGKPVAYPVLAVTPEVVLPLTGHAHNQLSTYTEIPGGYYNKMLKEDPTLLATNVNVWLHKELSQNDKRRDGRLVRTLGPEIRALLSPSYRRIDHEDLFQTILEALAEANLILMSADVTDRRLYVKAVSKDIEFSIPTGKYLGDGGHSIFDTIAPGVEIRNSEIGEGFAEINSLVYTKGCTNLMLMGAVLRKRHVGSRAEVIEGAYEVLTEETRQMTDRAMLMQVRDVTKAAFEEAQVKALVQKLGTAAEQKIPVAKATEVVELAAKRFTWNESEQRGIFAKLIEDGNFTRYGLHAAVTRHSADVESYDRATELEHDGGKLIEMDPKAFEGLVKEADALRLKKAA
jgi:hypothetical protein